MDICSIILSAGNGRRMSSDIPKPLHCISGKPMLNWVIDANKAANIKKSIIVLPRDSEAFRDIIGKFDTVTQPKPLGTGDAVKKAVTLLKNFNGVIIVCFADTPFISKKSIKKIISKCKSDTKLVITGFKKTVKNNYGKIIFSSKNEPIEIIEQKNTYNKKIESEFCNSGIMAFHSSAMSYLDKIQKNIISNEYYLTDLVKIMNKDKQKISFVEVQENEVIGVNDQIDLSIAENISQKFLREKAMLNGSKLIAPETVFFNYDTKICRNVTIYPNVVFGKKVVIRPFVQINSFSHLEDCEIKENSIIGPFARIRGNSKIGENSKVGNFVEIKKSNIHDKVKINHLSYIGDTKIGSLTNIGAGTITCNFDGQNKNETKIGKNSFIGSNSTIIAPIKIGDNVTLGAGSVFNKKIPNNTLSIGRAHQINKRKK